MASTDRIQPLASQDTNVYAHPSGADNLKKSKGKASDALKPSNHHHITTHKTVSTPTSSYKKSLKFPLLDQLGSISPNRKKSFLGSNSVGRLRLNDKENNPYVVSSNRFQQKAASSLLSQNVKGVRFSNIATPSLRKFSASNVLLSSHKAMTPKPSIEDEYDFDMSEISIVMDQYDGDNNNNDGSHTLTNAAAVIQAKLDELQDKENIPPLGSPIFLRPTRQGIAANALGVDLDLVNGINKAFPPNQYKRQPLSVISVAPDQSYAVNNYQNTTSNCPTPNRVDQIAEEGVEESKEEGEEEEEEEEDGNGRYIFLDSELAPEPGELDMDTDLDSITVSESESVPNATSSPVKQSTSANTSVILDHDFVDISPSTIAAGKTNSPRLLLQQEVLRSPMNVRKARASMIKPLVAQLQIPSSLSLNLSQGGSRRSTLVLKAPTLEPPKSTGSTVAPSQELGLQVSAVANPSSSIHSSTRFLAPATYGGVRSKDQKKKMVFMR